jgi:UDP-glucose 4-epimerase
MNILVSGAAGFLGSHLLEDLNKEHTVRGIGRVHASVRGIDVFGAGELETINLKPDVVILCHAAVASGKFSPTHSELFSSNVAFTEMISNLFSNAFIIYVSSVSVYPLGNEKISEGSMVSPTNSYALSKLWGELVVKEQSDFAIIRFPSLYGIGMKENTLIPNYINSAIKKNLIEVWGKGKRFQNYLHISDAVNYIKAVIHKRQEAKSKILLGTAPFENSNLQVAECIQEVTGCNIQFINEDNSSSYYYNNSYTSNLLQFIPVTTLNAGLKEYIEWKKSVY